MTAPEPGRSAFPVFGTTAHLPVTDPAALAPALPPLRTEPAALDAACSRFRPDSELSRVNARPEQPGAPVTRAAPGRAALDRDPVRRRLRLPAGTAPDLGATVKAWAAERGAP